MRSFLLRTALVVVVLGVLPVAWDAPLIWQVLGPVVAAALAGRAAVLVWQTAFSTDPRHLTPAG